MLTVTQPKVRSIPGPSLDDIARRVSVEQTAQSTARSLGNTSRKVLPRPTWLSTKILRHVIPLHA